MSFPARPRRADNAMGKASNIETIAAMNDTKTEFRTLKNSKLAIPSRTNHSVKIDMGSTIESRTIGSMNDKIANVCVVDGLIAISRPGEALGIFARDSKISKIQTNSINCSERPAACASPKALYST